jgi:hypothetical protein
MKGFPKSSAEGKPRMLRTAATAALICIIYQSVNILIPFNQTSGMMHRCGREGWGGTGKIASTLTSCQTT